MYSGRSGFESPLGYAIFGSDLGVSRSRKKCRSESGTTINKSGASGTQKDQESLKSKKTRRVWNRKRPEESGTKKTMRVWDQKDLESLEPEE
jgi:hypothetical protein